MADLLLELLSEEIPARMQDKARADLARLFAEKLTDAGLKAEAIETYATPRRLALIARGLPAETQAISEELKGPRTSAPPQALEGFLRKTGLTRDQLAERDGIWFARRETPGRPTAAVLAEAIPAIARAFPWPKSMRWGAASASTESIRWVRPLQGIVALLGERIVEFEIAGIHSGAATIGHRFHHPGPITFGGAHDYVEKLRACHVIVDQAERKRLIAEGAAKLAAEAGLALVEDEGLVAENAGLTEWPVPLLGSFDPPFLDVPREIIQLTMRANQKYFALTDPPRALLGEGDRPKDGGGVGQGATLPLHHASHGPPPHAKHGEDRLSPHFLCVANIDASDGGAAIVEGNRKVLAARLADARFFWEQDRKAPLEEQAKKLSQIVFHEKLGTVADKVERVAKLARWLVEEGIVKSSPSLLGEGDHAQHGGGARSKAEGISSRSALSPSTTGSAGGPPPRDKLGEDQETLATLAETAARLCKADLVTGLVSEFPELQGVIGGHLACAQGLDPQIAAAIRDLYKPVGQGDDVPTAPVTVAVSLADKLDTICAFFLIEERPSGSRDPFALRRAALGVLTLLSRCGIRLSLEPLTRLASASVFESVMRRTTADDPNYARYIQKILDVKPDRNLPPAEFERRMEDFARQLGEFEIKFEPTTEAVFEFLRGGAAHMRRTPLEVLEFFADRLKVQQREAGIRHDLIDAVFALGGEDDLIRLLARVKALQSFVETPAGADLLAGYKRAANILKKEGWPSPSPPRGEGQARAASQGEGPGEENRPSPSAADAAPPSPLQGEGKKAFSYTPENEEKALIAALDSAEPRALAAVEAEDFEGAMAALASLRAPVDAFFDKVTVNDPDPAKRKARLALLARMRDAVHRVADFSRIEG